MTTFTETAIGIPSPICRNPKATTPKASQPQQKRDMPKGLKVLKTHKRNEYQRVG